MKKDKINKISSKNCDLIFYNNLKQFIKKPNRIFFLKAKSNCERGNHAHKKCSQFFFSLNGKIEIHIDNGVKNKIFKIKEGEIIKIDPLNWVKVKLRKNQILAVFCDKKFSESEYIRNYKVFKKIIKLN